MRRIVEAGGGKVSFRVRLQPRSSRCEILGWTADGLLKIRVGAPPVEQQANRELVRFLSKELEVPPTDILIAAGRASRVKRLEVPAECKNRLSSYPDI